MHNFLEDLGISDHDIKNIIEFNEGLEDYESHKENIDLLKGIGCTEKEIRNIIISNPNVLIRDNKDLLGLVACLKYYGFDSLNLLFDSNPYLLNKDDFELKEYVEEKKKMGLKMNDIIGELENDLFDF